ncbi:MAG: Dabb family protein [Pirellulales bacterium]
MPTVAHTVLIRFRADLSPAQIDAAMAELAALKDRIPGIVSFSGGANMSPEGLNQGFTHGFVMKFVDAAARDRYLPHLEHEAVKERVLPLLDGGIQGVLVLDWEE